MICWMIFWMLMNNFIALGLDRICGSCEIPSWELLARTHCKYWAYRWINHLPTAMFNPIPDNSGWQRPINSEELKIWNWAWAWRWTQRGANQRAIFVDGLDLEVHMFLIGSFIIPINIYCSIHIHTLLLFQFIYVYISIPPFPDPMSSLVFEVCLKMCLSPGSKWEFEWGKWGLKAEISATSITINHPWLGMVNIPPRYWWWWLMSTFLVLTTKKDFHNFILINFPRWSRLENGRLRLPLGPALDLGRHGGLRLRDPLRRVGAGAVRLHPGLPNAPRLRGRQGMGMGELSPSWWWL